jgi:hypothetical protein
MNLFKMNLKSISKMHLKDVFFLRDKRYKGSYRKNSLSGDDDIVDVVVVVAFFAIISARAFVRLT